VSIATTEVWVTRVCMLAAGFVYVASERLVGSHHHALDRWISLHQVILLTAGNRVLVRTSVHNRLHVKVAVPRRAWSRPLKSIGVPGISASLRTIEHAPEEVGGEDRLAGHHADRTVRHKGVHRLQMMERLVVVSIRKPSWEAHGTQDVHREERAVEENEGQEEVHLPPELIHRAAKHLREPEVDRSPDAHRRTGEEHVVKVSYDEVGVVDEDVDGRGSHKNAR
jgi:hypothetical protein